MIQALLLFVLALYTSKSSAEPIHIYIDADFSNHSESAESMFMGLSTAFSEVGNTLQGRPIKIIKKDHRANSLRSLRNIQQFIDDPNAMFVLGGMHSPPYIQNRDYINENEVLMLVAWAAGGPITRYSDGVNWIFRLSLDDTKAGERLAQFAAEERGCQQPHLLLEDTPWGRSNYRALNEYTRRTLDRSWPVTWFGWNNSFSQARTQIREIGSDGVDCIIYVGSHLEAEQFAKATLSLDAAAPSIISHWGITGGDFHERVTPNIRQKLDLAFLQTCFSFLAEPQSEFAQEAFSHARELFPNKLTAPNDLKAPVGFVHAYDIGQLVIAALRKIDLSDSIKVVRKQLRTALENLDQPVTGLVKTYRSPFSRWSAENPDAHEALGIEDICVARFDRDNNIILLSHDR